MDHWLKHSWFLLRDDVDWTPSPDTNLDVSEQDLKKSARAQTFAVSTTDPVDRLLEQYGRWMDLLRVVAHLLRYRQFLRFRIGKAKEPTKGNLTVKELQKATIQMVKLVQQREFAKEYQSLLRHNPVALYTDLEVSEARQLNSQDIRNLKRNANGQGSSPWRRLNPIMIDDVIRVGGRLREAPVEFGLKHPMILPSRPHHQPRHPLFSRRHASLSWWTNGNELRLGPDTGGVLDPTSSESYSTSDNKMCSVSAVERTS